MKYYISKITSLPFDAVVKVTTEALKRHGFGILSDIDVQATLQKKLGVKFQSYRILGACNPKMAFNALQTETRIGTMLPCNVIVQEMPDGAVEVSAVDPVASMQAIKNPDLSNIAQEVRLMLQQVIDEI